ncbi:hypothetical protein A2U01_0080142, partial [Trifolium medium]|nr:hypothetical protein [Trifolium medium]
MHNCRWRGAQLPGHGAQLAARFLGSHCGLRGVQVPGSDARARS